MAIARTGERLTAAQQIGLRGLKRPPAGKTRADFRGRPLTLDFKGPNGEQLRAGEVIRAGAGRIARILAAAASRASQIELPEMIALSDALSIMRNEVTVGLFRQVMAGYEITGDNHGKLKAILADPSKREAPLTYVSLNDAREFAIRLSAQTGRSFGIQKNPNRSRRGAVQNSIIWVQLDMD